MRVIVFDFETYYDSKTYTLSKMSAVDYVRDAKFHVLCLGYVVNSGEPVVVEHEAIADALRDLRLDDKDTICVGHNSAGFDNLILSEVYGVHPAHMTDTLHLANWCGITRVSGGSLEQLAAFLGVGKKGTGTLVSDGKKHKRDFSSADWEAFKEYCANDVRLTRDCLFKMLPHVTQDAVDFSDITCHMASDPQFIVNPGVLEEYLELLTKEEAGARFRLQELFTFPTQEAFMKAIRSAATFCTMLRSLGVEPPMKLSEKQSATRRRKMEAAGEDISSPESWQVYVPALSKQDEEFLELQDHPDPRVRQLVQARLQHNTSIPRARALALLQTSDNGTRRVPVMLKCFSAHTSRYGAGTAEGKSDGVQFQNLAKRNKAMLPLRQAIRVPEGYVILSVDSSQIEARCLAYEAQELGLLSHFQNHRDPYSEQAEKFVEGISAKEIHDGAKNGDARCKLLRNIGKTCVLSCWEADTEVLTDTGWKRIVTVSVNDKLWDGEAWVQHQGLIWNGKKKTIQLDGTCVTPNHLIFDGISWNTAEDLVREPLRLNRARRYAESVLSTSPSRKTTSTIGKLCTWWNAFTAKCDTGCLKKEYGERRLRRAYIAQNVCRRIYGILHRAIQTIRLEKKSESLQCCGVNVDSTANAHAWNDAYSFNARAVPLPIGYCSPIYIQEKPRVATNVQNPKLWQRIQESTAITRIFARTQRTVLDCSVEFMRVLIGAAIQMTRITTAMAGAAYAALSPTLENILRTYLRCPVGMTQNATLTASITTGTMRPVICGLPQENKMSTIGELLNSWSRKINSCGKKSTACVPVYDIRNAGPRHRYVVRTRYGAVFVCHNCGYGVGAGKFAATLYKQGLLLAQHRDTHNEHARRIHSLYRQSNPAIVKFWQTCQDVIRHLAAGGDGYFGGPHGSLFEYAHHRMIAGRGEPVPCVILPSGYKLWYPGLRLEARDDGSEYVYDRRLGKNTVTSRLYGSMLAENCTQAFSFQILIHQACQIHKLVPLACNIHDAFIAVVHRDFLKEAESCMLHWMRTTPKWAEGLPLDAEAEYGEDFTIA